ncbi:MAG: 50S ribosomal protein L22 [Nanoarchaeota archaeon]
MTQYKCAYEHYALDKHAKAIGRDLPISVRASSEICKQLRFKPLERAKRILQQAIDMEKPIPFNRFTQGAGHKAGMKGGKYPIKACTHILRILESAEANAHSKGLAKDLKVIHVIPQKAGKSFHYGRQSRRKFKRTHIEVVLGEYKKEEAKPRPQKNEAKTEAKK